MDRLAMLRTMVQTKPTDPFPRYGLAMELAKQGQNEEARSEFETLVQQHPDYVATYLMFGNLLRKLGDEQAAASIYEQGMQAADRAGDAHAHSELQGARAELP